MDELYTQPLIEMGVALSELAVKGTASAATGTIGREVGKSLGSSFGSFGKTLGGNVGASLGRGIIGTLFAKK